MRLASTIKLRYRGFRYRGLQNRVDPFKCVLRPDSTHLFVIKYGDQCAGDATESGLTAEQQSDANVFIFFRSDFEIHHAK